MLSATKQQVFLAYLSQCLADNSYVTVRLSVLLIYKFLFALVYLLFYLEIYIVHNVQPAVMA